MVVNHEIIQAINILGRFCGKRDIKALTSLELEKSFEIPQVDIMVLFGGSVSAGGNIFANAIESNCRRYVIVSERGIQRKSYVGNWKKRCPLCRQKDCQRRSYLIVIYKTYMGKRQTG